MNAQASNDRNHKGHQEQYQQRNVDCEPTTAQTTNEIKQRIRMVRQLVDTEVVEEPKKEKGERLQSMDTGSILSFTFGFILFLLLAVGIYAFKNLYHAIVKRFS